MLLFTKMVQKLILLMADNHPVKSYKVIHDLVVVVVLK